jgi:lysophospholipase L1-like esterase
MTNPGRIGLLILALLLSGCGAPDPAPSRIVSPHAGGPVAKPTPLPIPAVQRPGRADRRPATPSSNVPLAPLFEALDSLEQHSNDTVTILQLGDSHTAGDRFSGRLRDLFQRRFGNAGRGMLPPGIPFPYYRPTQVSVTAPGWTTTSSFTAHAPGPFGLSGFRARASRPSDIMTIDPKDDDGFDRIEIGVVLQPGGGTLVVKADGVIVTRTSTRDQATGTGLLSLPLASPARHIEIAPEGDGPVEIISQTVQRNAHGVVLDSHGIVGTTITILDRWDRTTLAWELANRHPALIILAYGTNEGFGDGLTASGYTTDVARQLSLLHDLAPDAAILMVGPPDAERLPSGCPGANSPDIRYRCEPLSAQEEENYSALFKSANPRGRACRWHEPPNLAVVRNTQRQIAAAKGAAFWDWSDVMGRNCGLHDWTRAEPPLAALDHVHMTSEGYARGADALFTHLMRDYQSWRSQTGRPPSLSAE